MVNGGGGGPVWWEGVKAVNDDRPWLMAAFNIGGATYTNGWGIPLRKRTQFAPMDDHVVSKPGVFHPASCMVPTTDRLDSPWIETLNKTLCSSNDLACIGCGLWKMVNSRDAPAMQQEAAGSFPSSFPQTYTYICILTKIHSVHVYLPGVTAFFSTGSVSTGFHRFIIRHLSSPRFFRPSFLLSIYLSIFLPGCISPQRTVDRPTGGKQ